MPESARDFHNNDSINMFRVIAAGPGRTTRKGAFIPNEIKPGDNVIVDSRQSGRPEELGDGKFLIRDLSCVLAVVPMQPVGIQPESA